MNKHITSKYIKYSVVIPLYNEEEVFAECYKQVKIVMDQADDNYEIIFVNDGSRDKTPNMVREVCKNDSNIKFIDFSRNFGHQTAITAGMDLSSGQAIVVIDADLQDPPEVILKMIEKWKEGYDVVYGKRAKREGETFFKKFTSKMFYRILNSLTNVDIPLDTGDFRLIDRKVCDALSSLPERNRFVRGLVSWVGFKQTGVEFTRHERFAGETKYPLKKMLQLAFDGITSFSNKPLRFATWTGTMVSVGSFLYLIYVLLQKIITPEKLIPGWTSLMALVLIFNGFILIFLGVLGEYIGRIYDESKARPQYIIKDKVNFDENE